MKPWSHLANAHHIDWVIESLKVYADKWDAAWRVSWIKSRRTDHKAARHAATVAMLNAVDKPSRTATCDAAFDVSWKEADEIVFDVILALIAYDDCDQYLQMSYEQLLTYALLSEKPQAILLLPLKWIQENEALVAST